MQTALSGDGPLSGGTPLPAHIQRRFAPALGHDFSQVRVHLDDAAAGSARAFAAQAYTVGTHVVFGAGRYAPETDTGHRLLAHELAHVVQQQGGPPVLQRQPEDKKQELTPAPTTDPADKEIATRRAALKALGSLSATARVGSSTADTVEALIEASALLAPYLRAKVANTSVGKNFKIHDFPETFEAKQNELEPGVQPNVGGSKRNAPVVFGFFHRKTDSIHLRPDAKLGHALHEGIHKYSSVLLQKILGIFVNEGITQHYTDQVLGEHGVSGAVSHNYQDQLAAAQKLASWFTPDDLAKAYFQGTGVSELAARVRDELGIDFATMANLAGGNGGKDLGDRILAHQGKPARTQPPPGDKRQ